MMNERIRELATEVGISVEYLTNTKQWTLIEALAELIVKECIYRVRSRQQFAGEDQQNVTQAFDLLVYDLESHFGVEE